MAGRVLLTGIELADAPLINRWKNDRELQALSGEEATGESLAQTTARLDRWRSCDPERMLHFAIRRSAEQDLIGFCHLAEIDRPQRACKVGIVIGERALWGRGYGSEALEALLLEAVARNLLRVVAEVRLRNERSARAFARVGFALIGKQRSALPDGQQEEELIFAWTARREAFEND